MLMDNRFIVLDENIKLNVSVRSVFFKLSFSILEKGLVAASAIIRPI